MSRLDRSSKENTLKNYKIIKSLYFGKHKAKIEKRRKNKISKIIICNKNIFILV